MSNLEPIAPWGPLRDRRSQMEFFLKSGVPEADEVSSAVGEMFSEYRGFIRNVGAAVANAERHSHDSAEKFTEDVERVASFAVWRALVNREHAEDTTESLPGDPRRVPKVVSDGTNGYTIVREEADIINELQTARPFARERLEPRTVADIQVPPPPPLLQDVPRHQISEQGRKR